MKESMGIDLYANEVEWGGWGMGRWGNKDAGYEEW